MAVVLINSYTGNLTSYLSVPKLNPIPNSFEELAASSDYKLCILANSILSKSILVNMCVSNQNQELAASSDYKLSIAANTILMKSIMVKMRVTYRIFFSNEYLN